MIGTGPFVSSIVASSALSLNFLPLIVFLVAAFLSFSMGTAWGTFGILIPIVSMICAGEANTSILIVTLGATLAGSVYGDNCYQSQIQQSNQVLVHNVTISDTYKHKFLMRHLLQAYVLLDT